MSSKLAIRLQRWHRVRRVWWHENDSNDAKVITACGIRRDHADTHHSPPEDGDWCGRCYPYGKPERETILIKAPAQLRAFSGSVG